AITTIRLPSSLPAGEYLICHELIAIQLGISSNSAKFYPACFQVRLASPSHAAAELPSRSNAVTFSDVYEYMDPGILGADTYNPGHEYVFPGPPI
ncbi:glycoside hydrolase family 61 protein, partial [Serendipita vermifera MAFF 305830]